jgi:ribosomal protein L30
MEFQKNVSLTGQEVVRVRQVRGLSGRTKEVVRTVDALGLCGIGTSRVIKLNSATRGMIRRVHQLVVVEPVGQ